MFKKLSVNHDKVSVILSDRVLNSAAEAADFWSLS